TRHIALLVAVCLNVLFGLLLIAGGVWLIALGGSWYYALAGIALLVTAFLLYRRRPLALLVYAALMLATLIWALFEVGLDWWPLAARMDVLFLLGVFMVTPWVTRPLFPAREAATEAGEQDTSSTRSARAPLMGCLVLFLAVAIASWVVDPHQTDGTLPTARAEVPGDVLGVPPGE